MNLLSEKRLKYFGTDVVFGLRDHSSFACSNVSAARVGGRPIVCRCGSALMRATVRAHCFMMKDITSVRFFPLQAPKWNCLIQLRNQECRMSRYDRQYLLKSFKCSRAEAVYAKDQNKIDLRKFVWDVTRIIINQNDLLIAQIA